MTGFSLSLRGFWLHLLLIWVLLRRAAIRAFLRFGGILLVVILSGCAHEASHRTPIVPSMAAVSIPLQGTRDAIAIAQDRLRAGDIPATTTALSAAASKAEVTSQALAITQRNVDSLEQKLDAADTIIASQKAELHEVTRERDIIPYLVALCLALWLVFFTDGLPVPEQYRFWLKAGAFLIGFGAGYGLGRTIVRFIASFLP